MMALTNSLSTNIHQVRMNGQSERIQFVPQMLSTLRLDIVFWSNLRAEITEHSDEKNRKLEKLKMDGFIEKNTKWILEWDASTAYDARTEGGSFEGTEEYGHARAAEIMNSKSPNDFRWCLKIACGWRISVGIASTLQRIDEYIEDQDENSLTFLVLTKGTILKGKTEIDDGIDVPLLTDKRECEIQCRFQPKLKKFSFLYRNKEYDFDIKEDIDYFPVIQGGYDVSATLTKP